ncbi:hypothetical protein [Knoellia subterranea]|uniref:Uncharacterized protein n=1 Tax=Knoellia subterranea KCTC 19937 TaxID=1385521 RepID=A0A0A0JG26_9MICO|nr:hypothetical protein [Knoellia subterranea]KGN36078.1 hypothetical protein N803_09270 [Knoellia subterranea KCTC 19937]
MHPQTSTNQAGGTCASSTERSPIFPPRDADIETYRAWLARAAWPEVVFGARLPAPVTSR